MGRRGGVMRSVRLGGVVALVAGVLSGACAGGSQDASSSAQDLSGPVCSFVSVQSEIQLFGFDVPPAICLPRPLMRAADGSLDCRMKLALPGPDEVSADGATECDALDYARDLGSRDAFGHAECEVAQIAAPDGVLAGEPTEGWYYDDFSDAVARDCPAASKQRIAVTGGVRVPDATRVSLLCALALGADDGALTADEAVDGRMCTLAISDSAQGVGSACTPQVVPEGGFDSREVYVELGTGQCHSGACLTYKLHGDIAADCDPELGACAEASEIDERVYCSCRCSAGADAGQAGLCDCPGGFACVDVLEHGPESLAGGYCVRTSSLP